MRYDSPKVIDGAAEAVAYTNVVWPPTDPVEGIVVTAPVGAELQRTRLCQCVVRVVDADKRCA